MDHQPTDSWLARLDWFVFGLTLVGIAHAPLIVPTGHSLVLVSSWYVWWLLLGGLTIAESLQRSQSFRYRTVLESVALVGASGTLCVFLWPPTTLERATITAVAGSVAIALTAAAGYRVLGSR